MYALHVETGSLEWRFATGDLVQSLPAVGANGVVYVGSNDNSVYALAATGGLLFKFTAGGLVYSSPAIGANGFLYFGAEDGLVYALA